MGLTLQKRRIPGNDSKRQNDNTSVVHNLRIVGEQMFVRSYQYQENHDIRSKAWTARCCEHFHTVVAA